MSVTAVASLPSSAVAITNVDFYVDDQKFGQDAAAPYAASWTNPRGGVHRLTVVGRDTAGILYTSSPVAISLPLMLVSTGSVWKYLDTGANEGTNWTGRSYIDIAWASGAGEFGYGDGDEATVVGFGSEPDNKSITTYFRRAFFVQNATNYTNIIVNLISNPVPSIRVILSGSERATFPPQNRDSDAEANITFIGQDGGGTSIRYLGGVRIRGAGSRSQSIPNNRVNLPNDKR